MDVRKFWYCLISALVLAVCVGYGAPVSAQCSPTLYYSSPGPPVIIVKTVPAATMCTLTMFNNADCHPGGNYPPTIGAMITGGPGLSVSATQVTLPTLLTNPSCGWVCNCGATTVGVVINAATDGLPVELMDFAIEDGEAVGGGDESGDGHEQDDDS